jgi:hypothetical protein
VIDIDETGNGVRFSVHVQPRAARSGVAGVHGSAVKVRLQAPPVDGAANEALIALLAESLGVPRREVLILAGATSRLKRVEVRGLTAHLTRERLAAAGAG